MSSQYLTVTEFQQAPTAIDVSTLDQTNIGNVAAQNAALLNILRRASSWVDTIVRMPTLQATTVTEVKEVNILRDGRMTVHPDMIPILSLTSVGYRLSPNVSYTPVPVQYVDTYTKWFTVWNINSNTLSPSLMLQNQGFGYYGPWQMAKLRDMPVTLQYTYTRSLSDETQFS